MVFHLSSKYSMTKAPGAINQGVTCQLSCFTLLSLKL